MHIHSDMWEYACLCYDWKLTCRRKSNDPMSYLMGSALLIVALAVIARVGPALPLSCVKESDIKNEAQCRGAPQRSDLEGNHLLVGKPGGSTTPKVVVVVVVVAHAAAYFAAATAKQLVVAEALPEKAPHQHSVVPSTCSHELYGWPALL